VPETVLPLQGAGAVPVIYVSNSTVTFQPTLVGVTAPSQAILIGTNSPIPITLNLAQTTISPQFAFNLSGCTQPIYPGAPCAMTLTFTPLVAGNISGTLNIASNDPVNPVVSVGLSGVSFSTYPVPIITSISPQTAVIGGTGIQLEVYGQNFFPTSVISVSGEALSTTYQDTNFVYATIDPALLTTMTELPVTVTNPTPGGGTGAPVTLTTYLSVPMQVSAMIYDPFGRLIFAAIPAASATNPNTVVSVDPLTGNVSAPIAVGTDPETLAVSDDGQYLYVGVNGQNAIQRINLATLAIERNFALPVDPMWGNLVVREMHVVPGSPQTVVAALIAPDVDPDEDGMAAFNDVGLINWVPGVNAYPVSLSVDSFAFAGAPPVIYGAPATTPFGACGLFP